MDVLKCDPEAMAKAEVLAGGGDMGAAMMRAHDWSSSPLGPVEKWPQSLRTSVSTCLNSRFAILDLVGVGAGHALQRLLRAHHWH